MTAATKITVDERRDVLRVPDEALRYKPTAAGLASVPTKEGEETAVWVLRDGRLSGSRSKAAWMTIAFTEVKGGLQLGDQVIVSERSAGARAAVPPPRL